MEMNGKVAWVVGASSGIGAAVARELACRGATVAISARRDEQLREVSGGDMLVVRVNLAGMSNSIAAVLPGMLRRHHGVIAGIASVAGYRALPIVAQRDR
jgi:NADP-dependent 3-hydroxy acid dehydrogenase YdfG